MEWKELSLDKRLTVLQWARDSIKNAVQTRIGTIAYRAYVDAVQRGKPFDIERIWLAMPDPAKKHWEHARPFLDSLERHIDAIKREIAERAYDGIEK